MNTGSIETAFAQALAAEEPSLVVLKSRDDAEVPPDASFALVTVERCEHVAGNLWKATVIASVMTPAPLFPESEHNQVVSHLVGFVEGQSLYTSYNTYAAALGHSCGGGKLLYSDSEPDNNSYRHNIAVLLGLIAS